MCRIGGTLAAVITLVMFEAYLRPGEMLSLQPSSFLAATEGGVRSWVILLFRQGSSARSKTGEADEAVSLDSKRCLWMVPAFERLQLNYTDYLLLFGRAAGNLQVDMVPYQGRHFGASMDRAEKLRTLESRQKRGRWKSAKCVRRHEKSGRANQSWPELAPLVQAHREHCNDLLPYSRASWSRLSDSASTAPSFVIDLFSANTDCIFF